MFSPFWPSLPGPGCPPNELFLAQIFLETRLGVGNLRPASGPPSKVIWPSAPLPNCSNCMNCLVMLHFTILPSLQLIVLNTYKELLVSNRTINMLYVLFCAFVISCGNQAWISLKFHNFPCFTDILNSKEQNCWWKISTAFQSLQS